MKKLKMTFSLSPQSSEKLDRLMEYHNRPSKSNMVQVLIDEAEAQIPVKVEIKK